MNIDQILQSRYKRVNNYSYKLMGNQFGLDAAFSDSDLDINESEMSVVVPFADGNRRDGVGDLLEIGGIRTERHINNPIILFDHGKSVQLPIGLAEDPNTGEYTVELDLNKQKAYCKAFFYQGKTALGIDDAGKAYDHSVFCEQLFDLLSKKYIRAGSIGYQVIQAKELPANYETGSPKGLHLLSTLMLEASVVVLPANQDTVRKALCLSSVCGKPLSPILVKSLAPYAPNRKVQVGFSGTVPIPHGSEINTTNVPPVSWKPGVGAKIKFIKDISDIRLKYKKTYKLRRRLKKSAMGSSVIYVKKSDIDKIKEEAEKANVQLQLKGSTGGYEKVKLMGNDNFIDDIAKKYGRIIKSRKLVHNKKSLPNEGENMEDDLDLEEGYAPEEENDSDEPYGASVLRRIHEDHKILMEDYDKLLKPLENEGVRSHLQQILEHIEEILSLTEDLFTNTENYKDLKPLENKEEPEGMSQTPDEEEGDEDEDEEVEPSEESVEAVPADSESVDEPTPEEAIEGMKREKKNMMIKKQKGMCPACKKANCKCSPKCNSKNLKKKDEDMKEKGMEEENMEEKGMEEENMEEKGMEEENMEEKSQKLDIPSPDEEDEEKEEKQNEESIKQNYSKALQSYEKEMAQEGHSYLKELTDAQDYNDEHRMKSYHFHKVLGKIGGVEDEKCNKYYGMKKFVGDRNWMQEEAKEEEHELHPHRKMCGDASSYFKALSTERAFGDAHRAEADYHAKNMDAIFGENQEQKGTDVDENSSNEVENGSMGEMGETKKLKNLILRQNKELEELSRKLQNLSI